MPRPLLSPVVKGAQGPQWRVYFDAQFAHMLDPCLPVLAGAVGLRAGHRLLHGRFVLEHVQRRPVDPPSRALRTECLDDTRYLHHVWQVFPPVPAHEILHYRRVNVRPHYQERPRH
jgi:hypothetical protein